MGNYSGDEFVLRAQYQRSLILTCLMAVGDRPVRSAARRDTVLSGKRRDATPPVVNFSPVKQVNINDRWYKAGHGQVRAGSRTGSSNAAPTTMNTKIVAMPDRQRPIRIQNAAP